MSKDEPRALADRVEASEGPSRELDREIARLIHGDGWSHHSDTRYTASLDAAMTLVPEGWECFHLFRVSGARFLWEADIGPKLPDFRGQAATPALALAVAALRARLTPRARRHRADNGEMTWN